MTEKLNSAMDYEEHNKTYAIFINMTKYGTIGLVVLLAITLL